jgi:hypothetical protein
MTATDGGPVLHGADTAAQSSRSSGSGRAARALPPRLRTVLGLARVEASLLSRSVLVLAGVLVGGYAIWFFLGWVEPSWWSAAWEIGYGQLVLGMAVLIAAQLAVGRARRNAMTDLYASFPATGGTRTLAHLLALAGAAPASLLLIGAAVAVVQVRGAIGTPSIVVLAAGLLLVMAAGAVGVAIGAWFPHPLAGLLGALVLFLTSATSHLASGAAIWLVPWQVRLDQLDRLPGPLAGYPPAGGHAAELAAIAVLAGIVALALTASRARTRGGLAAAGVVAIAVICFAGTLQVRPIPTADLNHLVAEATDPGSVQHCATADHVRYCLYPGFGRQLPSLEAPVSAVLAHVPARPDQLLTVMQVLSLALPDSTLTHGHSNRQVSLWVTQIQRSPGNGNGGPASAIYLPVGSWPATGGRPADARFDLALAAADWAVRIPPQGTGSPTSETFLPCVPVDQAREAIAIWLAILATHLPATELREGLGTSSGPLAEVRNTFVQTWSYPGIGNAYVTPPGSGPQNTATGYLLASEMTSLPQQQLSHVLASAWSRWLNWRTTDAQLAGALGIPMPSVSTPAPAASGNASAPGPASGPQSPLCTS